MPLIRRAFTSHWQSLRFRLLEIVCHQKSARAKSADLYQIFKLNRKIRAFQEVLNLPSLNFPKLV